MSYYKHAAGTFKGKGDIELYFQSWTAPNAGAVLIVVHGLGEHSGRYGNLLHALEGREVSVYISDTRGFGQSGGKKGCTDAFSAYVEDQKTFTELIKKRNKNLPLFMLGHSFGGLIAFRYALENEDELSGLILSSPAFSFGENISGLKKKAAAFIARIAPNFTVSSAGGLEYVSHDMDFLDSCRKDPLIHNRISLRLFTEANKAGAECISRAFEITLPALMFHGKADRIADYKTTEEVFEKLSSSDREIKIFDGLYHQTMNEIPAERVKVLETVSSWIKRHIAESRTRGRKMQKRLRK